MYLVLWLNCLACRILVPRPGIEPVPQAVEAWSKPLDHQGSPSPYSLTLFIAMFLLFFFFYTAAFFTLHGICVDLPDLANENPRCL